MLLASCPSFVDRLSVVDGEIVPVSVCDGAGEEFREVSAFKLMSGKAWVGDDGTCKDDVPEPSDTARPSNWIDSVAIDAGDVMVSKASCKERNKVES
jgi:hypothetical protein